MEITGVMGTGVVGKLFKIEAMRIDVNENEE